MYGFYDYDRNLPIECPDLRSCLVSMWALNTSGEVVTDVDHGDGIVTIERAGYYTYSEQFSMDTFVPEKSA
jgi:hypothetical protein